MFTLMLMCRNGPEHAHSFTHTHTHKHTQGSALYLLCSHTHTHTHKIQRYTSFAATDIDARILQWAQAPSSASGKATGICGVGHNHKYSLFIQYS
jgi:hypothetical protein